MKFKKGKLYRVVKSDYDCVGCILKYKGFNANMDHHGKVIRLASKGCKINRPCSIFQGMIDDPNEVKMVEHENMVKFCKKLKKQLNKGGI